MDMNVNIALIKKARESNNWTQQQLADICGVSLRTIQRIEKVGACSRESLSALSSALELPREKLLIANPEPSDKNKMAVYKLAMCILTIVHLCSLVSIYFSRSELSPYQISIFTLFISAVYLGSISLVLWNGIQRAGFKFSELFW
ncbi:helix-turn-helix domain-containing protein [Microbulbifer sp. ZKSA004]|uniref:helix-turn-helix domain-containing protein n=1 Tax=Microbulbifer sp. ZKSA004 TaxID=3243389 RepID=UPI0040397927